MLTESHTVWFPCILQRSDGAACGIYDRRGRPYSKSYRVCKGEGFDQSHDVVILVHGLDDAVSKSTNVVKVIEIDKQSYSSPKHSFFSGIHIPFT